MWVEGERDVFSVELLATSLWSVPSSAGGDRMANGAMWANATTADAAAEANKFKMRGKRKQTKNSCQCNRWGQMKSA